MMVDEEYTIRNATPSEYLEIGELMVQAYSMLDGFPNADEQPDYYEMLASIGKQTVNPQVELLAALSSTGKIAGAVVYFGDMTYYGSGGSACEEKNAAGFRLLAVASTARGRGIGKRLTCHCIEKAKQSGRMQLIIHTTASMQIAWRMYEGLGFKRSVDLDFDQGELPVFGFRLTL